MMKKVKLHTVTPTLNMISKKSGFTVPNNYFETIENAVYSKMKTANFEDRLKENTYNTPENYFDNIEELVITKLKAEASQEKNNTKIPIDYFDTFEDNVISKLNTNKKVYTLKNLTKYVAPIAIAASLLLIFILNTSQESVSFDSLALTEIETLIDEGIIDADTHLLADAFSDIELSTEQQISFLTNNEALDYLSDEDLEMLMYDN